MRVVQIGDVAHVASAIASAVRDEVEMSQLPLRQVGAARGGLLKALASPLRVADAVRVARAVRSLEPDVVHVHWVPSGVVGPLTRRPWLLHVHGSDLRRLNLWRRLSFSPILRMADAVVVSTPDLLEFAPTGASYLPTPIALQPVTSDARWDVLVASVPSAAKGTRVAFEALRQIHEKRPELKLAALDGPEFEAGPWERLTLTDRDRFHARLTSAKIVLGQFGIGALGISDLETMALGRPLLTWVRQGLYPDPPPVVSVRQPDELAVRALGLLDAEDALRAMRSAGPEWVRRTHGPERVATQLLAIYRRLAC